MNNRNKSQTTNAPQTALYLFSTLAQVAKIVH